MSQRVGFIGLGAMGDGMTKNLLKAGFTVRGYDIDSANVQRLVDAGGEAADSPAQAAEEADLLLVCVFSSVVVPVLPGIDYIVFDL